MPWNPVTDPLPSGVSFVLFDARSGRTMNGAGVAAWKAVNSTATWTQTDAAKQPVVGTFNGQDVIRSDAFGKTMTLPNQLGTNPPGGIWFYGRAVASQGSYYSLLGSTTTYGASLQFVYTASTPLTGIWHGMSVSRRFSGSSYSGGFDFNESVFTGLSASVSGVNVVLRYRTTRAANTFLGSASFSNSTFNNGAHALFQYWNSETATGWLGSVVFFVGGVPTDADYETLETWAATQWSDTASLPTFHPASNQSINWWQPQSAPSLWADWNLQDQGTVDLVPQSTIPTVSTLREASGNGRDLTNTNTGSGYPRLQYDATRKAYSALFFNGGTNLALQNLSVNFNSAQFMVVALITNQPPNTSGAQIVSFASDTSADAGVQANSVAAIRHNGADQIGLKTPTAQVQAATTGGSPIIVMTAHTGSIARVAINGGLETSVADTASFAATRVAIGNDAGNGVNNTNVFVNRILVFTAYDFDTRQLAEGHIAWTHGYTDLLPAGHPYKNTPPAAQVLGFGQSDVPFGIGGTASGWVEKSLTSTPGLGIDVVASGQVIEGVDGGAIADLGITGQASGSVQVVGNAAPDLGLGASASAVIGTQGVAVAGLGVDVTASGEVSISGQATPGLGIGSAAAGTLPGAGQSVAGLGIGATASASVDQSGRATAGLGLAVAAEGRLDILSNQSNAQLGIGAVATAGASGGAIWFSGTVASDFHFGSVPVTRVYFADQLLWERVA